MTTLREAAQMALDALESSRVFVTSREKIKHPEGTEWYDERIEALRAALAQPEQEPVAFYVYKPTLPRGNLGNVADGDLPWIYDQDPSSGYSARMLVYTTPPQREWQGLTPEDKRIAGIPLYTDQISMSDAFDVIEKILKEKNT